MIDLDAISTMINANPDWQEFYKGLPVESLELDEDYLDEESPEYNTAPCLDVDSDYSDYIPF
ncbi:hypothetical protein VKI21_02120 [Cyanobacterium aponinum UTEX 3222]|uniref:hypothetical protein n=1 Tax=Cyanobacterium aponinum TaxID=379064 RepID=UPI003091EB10|nr:hypothetical protein VKI21_02120 [Cyanobacterium aponinum UTEX 3222]